MNDSFHINTGLDIKADLTQSAKDITAIAKDTHKGLVKLIYALFGPMIEKRIGQAKRFAAQADKDCLDIANELKVFDGKTETMVPIKEVSSIDALCEELERVNSSCKAKRLAMAIMTAANEIKQTPPDEISDEPLNQTFFNHWRTEAELIEEEDLRNFWAHLLVEETKKPNSISPRTLEVAKNLSTQEAQIYERMMQYCFDDTIIVNSEDYPLGGEYSDILSLQDAGIIGQISNRWYKGVDLPGMPDKHVFMPIPGYNFILTASVIKLTFRCHFLTTAGKQLLSILHIQKPLDNIKIIAKEISRQNNSVMIKLHSYIPGQPLLLNTPIWTSAE